MMRQRDTELRNGNRDKGRNRDTKEHTERYTKKALETREGSFLHLQKGSSQLAAHSSLEDKRLDVWYLQREQARVCAL